MNLACINSRFRIAIVSAFASGCQNPGSSFGVWAADQDWWEKLVRIRNEMEALRCLFLLYKCLHKDHWRPAFTLENPELGHSQKKPTSRCWRKSGRSCVSTIPTGAFVQRPETERPQSLVGFKKLVPSHDSWLKSNQIGKASGNRDEMTSFANGWWKIQQIQPKCNQCLEELKVFSFQPFFWGESRLGNSWRLMIHAETCSTNANKAEAMQNFWRNGSFSMAPMAAQSILQSGSCPWMLTCWAGFPFTQVDDVLKVPNFQAATFGSRYFNKLHLIFRLIRGALPHSHARSAFCSDWWINCCVWR